MLVFVTLDDHHSIEKVQGEIEPGELFRTLAAERDRGLSVRGVARGGEKLVEPLLPLLPPLMGPLCVISLEVRLQGTALDESGITALYQTDMRPIVLMGHLVVT
jgi:hypothetical protein